RAELGADALQLCLVPVDERDPRAVLQEARRERPAQAPGSPGDDRDLTVEARSSHPPGPSSQAGEASLAPTSPRSPLREIERVVRPARPRRVGVRPGVPADGLDQEAAEPGPGVQVEELGRAV